MITIDGAEYLTKEEAIKRCKAYVAANPGTTFHNYAHCKAVRRPITEAERAEYRQREACVPLTITVCEWNELNTGKAILKTHPELKGLWRERQMEVR